MNRKKRKPPHYRGTYHRRSLAVVANAYANPDTRCGRCGRTLYEHPRTKRTGRLPRWSAGHVNAGQINGPLRPEVLSCNSSAGATMGNLRRKQRRSALTWGVMSRCAICGQPISVERKYCSQRCGWIAHKNDPPKTPHPRQRQPKPEPAPRYCTICGGLIPKGRRALCSNPCSVEYNRRAARERYRERQGLPTNWEQPTKPWLRLQTW